jgi:hypothetical protein
MKLFYIQLNIYIYSEVHFSYQFILFILILHLILFFNLFFLKSEEIIFVNYVEYLYNYMQYIL